MSRSRNIDYQKQQLNDLKDRQKRLCNEGHELKARIEQLEQRISNREQRDEKFQQAINTAIENGENLYIVIRYGTRVSLMTARYVPEGTGPYTGEAYWVAGTLHEKWSTAVSLQDLIDKLDKDNVRDIRLVNLEDLLQTIEELFDLE